MFTDAEKAQFLAEAKQATQGTSQSINQYLAAKAKSIGMSMEDAEKGMGWQPGSLSSVQPVQQPQQTANLGMGTSTAQGPQPAAPSSSVTPLSAADRDSWRGRFDSQAAASGRTAGDLMYEYAQQNNLSNADVDRYMGYNSGTSDNWVAANRGAGQNATIAGNNTTTTANGPYQNLGMGGGSLTGDGGGGVNVSGGGSPIPAGGGGSGSDSTNTTTGRDIMGPGWRDTGGVNPGYPGVNNANPYLANMGADIGRQISDTWNRNILPGIRSGAQAAGGYGGSRQGVVEANAMNDLGKNYVSGLTNLYGTDWTNQQSRNLQNKGMDQSYDLGLRNNDLGFGQLDANIHNSNFNNQLASANFGLGVQNQLNQNNQTGIAAGTQIQNTQLDYQKYYNDAIKGYGNAGGTRNGTTTT